MLLLANREKKLARLLTSSVFIGALLVLSIFTAAVTYFIYKANQAAAIKDISILLDATENSFAIFDKTLKEDVQRTGDTFRAELGDQLQLSSEKQDLGGIAVPVLHFGQTVLNGHTELLDRYTEKTGAIATLFVREGSDFYRVSSSLKKLDGTRTVGTMLDHEHPAFAKLSAGQKYIGMAKLFGKNYMTYYNPVLDKNGQVAIVIFVGINIDASLQLLKERVKAVRIGETGYFYAVEAKPGKELGMLTIHPVKEGLNVLESKSADGKLFIKTMLEQKQGEVRYQWINTEAGETSAREKTTLFRSVPSMGWILAGGAYTNELVQQSMKQIFGLALLAGALLLIGCLGFAVLLKRVVTGPLEQATMLAGALAGGDLRQRVEVRSQNEIGKMLDAMNGIGDGLGQIVLQVRQGALSIQMAAQEIETGNVDLSARTEAQAGSLEETASSMEELTSTVQQNAANANQADRFVSSASTVASQAGSAVAQMVDTMNGIHESSRKVEEIINVINGIAFQTNILALNAAVEAARAGEQGRGFAVVASEVRNLAQRAAAAAKDIQTLIQESTAKVSEGSSMAEGAGTIMQQVVNDIRKVAALVNEISHASQEQSSGIAQVNDAVTNMDEMTQQNAALVEQAAAAAESMREQADQLAGLMAQFRV